MIPLFSIGIVIDIGRGIIRCAVEDLIDLIGIVFCRSYLGNVYIKILALFSIFS